MRQLRLRRIIRDKTAKISDYEEGSQWFSDRPITRLRQIRRVPSVSIFRIFSVKNEITMEAKLKFDQMENIDIDIYIHVVFNVPDHESNRTEYDEAGIVCRCSSKAGSRLCRAPIP